MPNGVHPPSENGPSKASTKGFQKGVSGNLAGRPKGSRNKATILAQELLDDEADAIVRKAIELATEGNPVALRMCLERLVPPRRGRAVELQFPKIKTAADLLVAHDTLMAAVICFAQTRAMSKKVGDQWTVPLCATHHRALHDAGDERGWWGKQKIDPIENAKLIWLERHGGHKNGYGLAQRAEEVSSGQDI